MRNSTLLALWGNDYLFNKKMTRIAEEKIQPNLIYEHKCEVCKQNKQTQVTMLIGNSVYFSKIQNCLKILTIMQMQSNSDEILRGVIFGTRKADPNIFMGGQKPKESQRPIKNKLDEKIIKWQVTLSIKVQQLNECGIIIGQLRTRLIHRCKLDLCQLIES